MAEAEAGARALDDPLILAEALYQRAAFTARGQRAVASRVADEALACASASGDLWTIAMATWARAMAAGSADELRQRVDEAVHMLERAGNVWHLAALLGDAGEFSLSWGCDHDALRYLERATPLLREVGEPIPWMLLRGSFGLSALFTGDTEAARDAFREVLGLCHELGTLPVASEGLVGLAAVATIDDDLDRAARLAAAAAAHRYDQPDVPVDDRLRATFIQPARARLGAEAWDAAARAGAALSLERGDRLRPRLSRRRVTGSGRAQAGAAAPSGKRTPVSSSDSAHSAAATRGSLAAALRPTSVGWPRPSWKPSGPT